MKIVCCCLTCIIGKDPDQSSGEEERLIEDEKEPSESLLSPKRVTNPERSSPVASPEFDDDSSKKAAEILKKNKVSLTTKKSVQNESFNRAVGVLKKYNLAKQYDLKSGEELQLSIDLRISIKIMVRSEAVKIFAIEASNVLPVLKKLNSDADIAAAADELLLIQLRTKLLPCEVRGHSKKFQVYENVTGSMKFSNELLHTFTIADYKTQQIRFRLYNVFKHKKDILLGEYILDLSSLNINVESGTTGVILRLHDPNVTDIVPPEVCESLRLLSSSSGTGSSGQSSTSSGKPYRSTIRRGDVKTSSRKGLPLFSHGSDSEQKPGSPSSLRKVEENVESSDREQGSVPNSPFQKLFKGMTERTENIEQLQTATEEMCDEANTFSDVSTRLREKYEKKHSKKRLI